MKKKTTLPVKPPFPEFCNNIRYHPAAVGCVRRRRVSLGAHVHSHLNNGHRSAKGFG